jgi:hypothetical protein
MAESTIEKRIWARIDKDGPIPDYAPELGPCWLWLGPPNSDGYGHIGEGPHKGRLLKVHRVTYELLVGPIPEGLELDHLCRVRLCVNPVHLEAVTNRENMLRGVGVCALNARKTHCKHGHEFTPENTYRVKNGGRACKGTDLLDAPGGI